MGSHAAFRAWWHAAIRPPGRQGYVALCNNVDATGPERGLIGRSTFGADDGDPPELCSERHVCHES